jgi:hypothetical protein
MLGARTARRKILRAIEESSVQFIGGTADKKVATAAPTLLVSEFWRGKSIICPELSRSRIRSPSFQKRRKRQSGCPKKGECDAQD